MDEKLVAENYANVREKNEASLHYKKCWASTLLKYLPKSNIKLLDYGCGTGILHGLLPKNVNYLGIDISDELLTIAHQKKIRAVKMDGENLAFDKEFDAIVSWGSLHHLHNPEKGIKQIRKSLKQNGIFIASEPTSNRMVRFLRQKLYKIKHKNYSEGHISFGHDEIVNIVKNSGLEIMSVEPFGLLAFPLSFPDIFPVFRHVPLWLMKILMKIDSFLLNVPLIRSFRFVTTVVAKNK